MERAVAWDGCLNARDLGGLPLRGGGTTRPGVVIRSDDQADPAERARLAAELATDPETLLCVFARLDAEWGSTTAFLLGCGVSSSALEGLRTALAP